MLMTRPHTPTRPTPRPWACPGSKLILPAAAPREDWLAARRTGIGGSDAAALMYANPYDDGSPWFVWRSKVEQLGEQRRAVFDRGHALEPIIKSLFTARTGIKTRAQGLHRSRTHPTMIASVDALTDDGGGLECKTTTEQSVRNTWPGDGSCPEFWAWQARHYLAVTRRTHWWVAALVVDTWELRIWRIDRDPDLIDDLVYVEEAFWTTYVETGTEPPLDEDLASMTEIRARFPFPRPDSIYSPVGQDAADMIDLHRQRLEVDAAIKELEDHKADLSRRIAARITDREAVHIDGAEFFTFKSSPSRRLHADTIAAAYPDIDLDRCYRETANRTLLVKKNPKVPKTGPRRLGQAPS